MSDFQFWLSTTCIVFFLFFISYNIVMRLPLENIGEFTEETRLPKKKTPKKEVKKNKVKCNTDKSYLERQEWENKNHQHSEH